MTEIDKGNPWRGEVCHFWGIDKPEIKGDKAYFAFTKLGKFFMRDGEGWVVEASNILTERDPDKLEFRLPEGDKGIRNPALAVFRKIWCRLPAAISSVSFAPPTVCPRRAAGQRTTWSLPESMATDLQNAACLSQGVCRREPLLVPSPWRQSKADAIRHSSRRR